MRRPVVALWLFLFSAALAGAQPEKIVFAGYNVENYLVMERRGGPGEGRKMAPKPAKAIKALLRVIKEINPDILGLNEMGPPDQFEDFQKRLKDAGLDYPHAEFLAAADENRHVALLSRFPISSRQSLADLSFELNGTQQKVRRGILDVTVQVNPDYELRLLGVHLKSKVPVPEGEALLRRNEAQILRKHIEKILAATPGVNLLLFGDINATKNEPPVQEIKGVRGRADYMADLWLADKQGDRWTHYWKHADIYSRIDFAFVSRGLMPEIIDADSYIYRSDFWQDASDHRPVVVAIRPVEK